METDLDVTISCSEGYNGDMDRTIEESVSGDSIYRVDIVGLSGEEGNIQRHQPYPSTGQSLQPCKC